MDIWFVWCVRATFNLDEIKSAPKSLFNRPILADSVGQGAYGSLSLSPLLWKVSEGAAGVG